VLCKLSSLLSAISLLGPELKAAFEVEEVLIIGLVNIRQTTQSV